jgi:hypothetical protein
MDPVQVPGGYVPGELLRGGDPTYLATRHYDEAAERGAERGQSFLDEIDPGYGVRLAREFGRGAMYMEEAARGEAPSESAIRLRGQMGQALAQQFGAAAAAGNAPYAARAALARQVVGDQLGMAGAAARQRGAEQAAAQQAYAESASGLYEGALGRQLDAGRLALEYEKMGFSRYDAQRAANIRRQQMVTDSFARAQGIRDQQADYESRAALEMAGSGFSTLGTFTAGAVDRFGR